MYTYKINLIEYRQYYSSNKVIVSTQKTTKNYQSQSIFVYFFFLNICEILIDIYKKKTNKIEQESVENVNFVIIVFAFPILLISAFIINIIIEVSQNIIVHRVQMGSDWWTMPMALYILCKDIKAATSSELRCFENAIHSIAKNIVQFQRIVGRE